MVCFAAIGGLFALLLPPALMSHSETFAAASDTSFGSANEKQPAAKRPTAVRRGHSTGSHGTRLSDAPALVTHSRPQAPSTPPPAPAQNKPAPNGSSSHGTATLGTILVRRRPTGSPCVRAPHARPDTPTASPSPSSTPAPSDSESASSSAPATPAFYLADAPPKGRGLRAARALARGTVVLAERPLFTQPAAPARCTNSSILTALAPCTREQQRDYFALANAHRGDARVLPALGVFETNALRCDGAGVGLEERRGVFLTAARLNHACAPNLARAWDAGAQTMVFRALRAIAPGEELGVAYGDVLGVRAVRRAALRARFGFECACGVCVLEGAALEESERRRETARRLYDEVGACTKEPTLGMRKVSAAAACVCARGGGGRYVRDR